jgi:DNA polymerase-3 subunit beta
MKIAAKASELAQTLSLAELALDAKPVVAILACVFIRSDADGTVQLVANALDRVIVAVTKMEVAEPGEAVVRASALAGLVSGLPRDATVIINADAQNARVHCGRATYKLPVLPVEQLPSVPAIDKAAGEVELDRKDLLTAIKQVTFAASTEETRYYLNGILLHDERDQLALVATDGYRLSKRRILSAPFSEDHSCIVPLASIPAITKLLTRVTAEKIRLRRSKALLELSASGLVLTTKLIDGTYPAYENVIPTTPANSVIVDRTDLVGALTRLNAVVEYGKLTGLVGFAWDPAEPVLHLSLPNQPGAADDVIAATTAGSAAVQTAAQIHHVIELVDEFRGEALCIATAGAGNPILITDPESDALLTVQMPCAVSSQARAA